MESILGFLFVSLVLFSIPLGACLHVIKKYSITNILFKAVLVAASILVVAPANGWGLYFALIILGDGFNLGSSSPSFFVIVGILIDAVLVVGLYDAAYKEIASIIKFGQGTDKA